MIKAMITNAAGKIMLIGKRIFLSKSSSAIVPLLMVFMWSGSPTYLQALELGKLNPVEREAPAFGMKDLQEQLQTREILKGKITIVNFWASWCGPCRYEMPSLNRAWAKMEDQGIAMLAVNMGESMETINQFIEQVPIDFPVLQASEPSSFTDWGIRGLPTTIVVDASGTIVLEMAGPAEWDQDELLSQVLELRQN